MKIVFFGLGSIGLRHARILQHDKSKKLYALRSYKGLNPIDLSIPEITSWKEIDTIKPDVAFITNPTFLHVSTAIECAQRGIHLFIEKPIDSRLTNLAKLKDLVKRKKITTYVAYFLRFHPVIEKLKKMIAGKEIYHVRVCVTSNISRWRQGKNFLKRYSARKESGGGVVLDLSHELDYVDYLFGPINNINGRFYRRGKVTVDAEDYADIIAETKSAYVNVHMNFASQFEQRWIQVDLADSTLVGDLRNFSIKVYKKDQQKQEYKFSGTMAGCYEKQMKYFFVNIHNPKMMNNILQASDLFEKIVKFKESSK